MLLKCCMSELCAVFYAMYYVKANSRTKFLRIKQMDVRPSI